MEVQALGHVVLKVRDRHRSEAFYSGVLGLRIISRISDPPMTFFSVGTQGSHHDFAVIEVGDNVPRPNQDATGLAHVAFNIGSSPDALRLAREDLRGSATPVLYAADRTFTKSVHLLDPDRNEVELYIDVHPQSSDMEQPSAMPR
jgi:catechol-2,3-dioxygenase